MGVHGDGERAPTITSASALKVPVLVHTKSKQTPKSHGKMAMLVGSTSSAVADIDVISNVKKSSAGRYRCFPFFTPLCGRTAAGGSGLVGHQSNKAHDQIVLVP